MRFSGEAYGFSRSAFPLEFNGHRISLLRNDGYIEEGRLFADLHLYCTRCEQESRVATRLPYHMDKQKQRAVSIKLLTFATFQKHGCGGSKDLSNSTP